MFSKSIATFRCAKSSSFKNIKYASDQLNGNVQICLSMCVCLLLLLLFISKNSETSSFV